MRLTRHNNKSSTLVQLTALLISITTASVCDSARAQSIAEPELPSLTDQHGVKLNSGSISLANDFGRIGSQRLELSRSEFRSENGFEASSLALPRDNLLDIVIHYDEPSDVYSIAVAEIEDRFGFSYQTGQFAPINATVSTLDNVAGNENFTDLIYTAPSGTVYTFEAFAEPAFHASQPMARIRQIEYPDGEIWTVDGNLNLRTGFRSNNLGYSSYPYLTNLGHTRCEQASCSEYNPDDWPGAQHNPAPVYTRGALVTGQIHIGGGNTINLPRRHRDATITYSNGDAIKANFDVQTDTWPTHSRVLSVERHGSIWTYEYGGGGSGVTSATVTTPSGTKERFYFHTSGPVEGKLHRYDQIPAGGGTVLTTQYEYDSGRLDRVTYPEGNVTELNRDAFGRIEEIRQIAKPGAGEADMVKSYTYDPCGAANRKYCARPRTYTDERGKITKYSYSSFHGGITEVQRPFVAGEGYHKTRTEYGQFHAWYRSSSSSTQVQDSRPVWRKIKEISCVVAAESTTCTDGGSNVRVTEYHYEQGNATTPSNVNLQQVIARSGDGSVSSSKTFTHDTWGRVRSEDGPLSGQADMVWYEYDNRDNVTRETKADPDGGGPQRYTYERREHNLVNQVTLVETGWTTSELASNRVDTVLGSVIHAYDTYGRREKLTIRDMNASEVSLVQTSYDTSSRVDCETLRMDVTSYSSLPAACIQTNPANPTDRITKTYYDSHGRAYKTSFALGTSVEMSEERSFTGNGLKKSVEDGNGNVTTYEYDGLDRLYQTRFPNKTGGGSSATDIASIVYGVENGLSTPQVQFDRKRSHFQGTTAEVEFSYDDLSRVKQADPTGTTNDVTTTYDEFGNIETLTKNGNTITYDWDALGRLKSETTSISGQTFTVSYLYDAAGRRIRMAYPDGNYLTYEYWGSGGIRYIRENGSNVVATYEYDAFGRSDKLTFGNGVYRELDYNAANRVSDLNFTVPSDTTYSQEIDYDYNVAGQITSKTFSNDLYEPTALGDSADYGINGLNQITDETVGGTVSSFSYDKNANLTSDGTESFTYDLFNRLITAISGTTLEYDASGRLYSIISPAGNTYFVYDGTALIGEYAVDGSGNVSLLRRYLHGMDVDTPIVWYEGGTVSNSTRRYLVRDELGSVVLIADNNGDAIHHNAYDEFGAPDTGNLGRFQYTGQSWLDEVGLYHYKARVYDPYLGRFLQTDPIGYGDGMNMYAYAGNDPINFFDPNGMEKYSLGVTAVGVVKVGAKGEAVFSFDTETLEMGLDVTVGLRYGVDVGLGFVADIEESGTEATNNISGKVSVNVEGSIGPLTATQDIVTVTADDDNSGVKWGGDTDGAVTDFDPKRRGGASVGVDTTIGGTTSVLGDGVNKVAEVLNTLDEIIDDRMK